MLRIAATADLHFGSRHTQGHAATLELAAELWKEIPDVLILAGDIGAGEEFARCLELFDNLPCDKLLVPGNHDIWVRHDDLRGNSFDVYENHLPRLCRDHGFHYLDHGPFIRPDDGVGFAGCMNWYDGSWSRHLLLEQFDDAAERIAAKRFARGMHNDANFVRWSYTDETFCRLVVQKFRQHLDEVLSRGLDAIVVAHHPPLFELLYPAAQPWGLDELLWQAFSGNREMEVILHEHADRIPLVLCGHTHYEREAQIGRMHGINIGGDYHFKRLLRIDWPNGEVRSINFGQSETPKKRVLKRKQPSTALSGETR